MSELKPLTEAETTELLDWVSACQSSYHIDSTPGHRFGGLGSNLQENRESLVEYVNELIAARAQPAHTMPMQCKCFDEAAKKYCADKGKCSQAVAQVAQQPQAEAVQYTSADIDRAYSAGLVEGERLAIQQAEAVPTDADLDSIIEKHLHSYWQYGALEQDRLRALARTLIATKAAPQQAEAVPPGYVLVPVEPSRGIEAAIARARNLKASEIWEWAIDAAIAQQKGQP